MKRIGRPHLVIVALGALAASWPWGAGTAQETPPVRMAPGSYQIVRSPTPRRFELSFALDCTSGVSAGTEARVVFDFRNNEEFLCARMTGEGVSLAKVARGRAVGIGKSYPLGLSLMNGRREIVLRRGTDTVEVFVDGQIAAMGCGSGMEAGGVGFGAINGQPRFDAVRFQELGEVYFTDDFMREGEAGDQWEPVGGQWAVSHLKDVSRSANPFGCVGRSDGPGLLLTGRKFWCDYEVVASAKCRDGGGFGLCFYYIGRDDHYLFRWHGPQADPPNRIQLVHVQAGQDRMLAEKAASYRPDQWYRLSAKVLGGKIEAAVDGQTVLDSRDPNVRAGRAGLYASRTKNALFDDVRIASVNGFADDFAESVAGRWTPLQGEWVWRCDAPAVETTGRGEGLLVAGPTIDKPHSVECDVDRQIGAVGLAVRIADSRNYLAFGVNSKGEAALLEVRDGARKTISAQALREGESRRHKLRVDLFSDYVCAGVDGVRVIEAALPGTGGRCGLYAEGGNGARFGRFCLVPVEERAPVELFSKVFETDKQMDNWASIWGSWEGGDVWSGRGHFWHKGHFFGDVSLSARPRVVPEKGGRIMFLIGGDGRGVDSGYRVEFSIGSNGTGGRVSVLCQGRELALKEIEAQAAAPKYFGACKRGRFVSALLDEEAVLTCEGDQIVAGERIGLGSEDVEVALRDAKIRSNDVYDYLFDSAPVDWELELGTWEVTNRWVCDPRWSWLGGRSDLLATIWHKKEFRGDVVVEFFAGFQMRQGPSPYPHLGDINLTICGDGRNLDSGYSFIYGGWGNRWTRILRKGEIVSGTDAYLISRDNHRRWFHVKAAKIGNRVQLFIDGNLVRQFTDPAPLPGGRIGIWTYDNGIMLARVRIYSGCVVDQPLIEADPGEYAVLSGDGKDVPPLSGRQGELIRLDFEDGTQGWTTRSGLQGALVETDGSMAAGGRHSLKLTNLRGGGDFGALLRVPGCDLGKFPVIAFDYKIPPSVRVNLYLRISKTLYEVLFNGPSGDWVGQVRPAGKFPDVVADDRWHHATIDLRAALPKMLRQGQTAEVEEIILGNLSNRDYLLCGFGANHAGASYHLDNFTIHDGNASADAR